LRGQARGFCLAYYSAPEEAQDTLVDKYEEITGEVLPGLFTPFPDDHFILQEAVAAYISGAGTWNGSIGDTYYGYA
jgi:hypothetical protein